MNSTLLKFQDFTSSSFLKRKKSQKSQRVLDATLKTLFFSFIFLFNLSATQYITAQPAQPAGFVANPSSGAGEVFLACGPNDVGSNGIVYKLFYSPTASPPSDPLTATEHVFGSIGGDGSGVNPFGFTMSGLTPGTDYTFWLFQYDTGTMEYSTPATATQTSGAAGGPPDAPVGFVANTGNNSGEVFLACGPNDVGANGIVYKLFYSLTSSAPSDPLTATEHIFGTVGGDGGGTNPFGFYMTGLAPGTDYTFWLYQYDTNTMLYSVTPATGTPTSSGTLPVVWNQVKARVLDNKQISVNWSVAQQLNNDRFIIEYSKNGVNFSQIGSTAGAGNSNTLQEYNFTHRNPVQGNNYYRIQQIDYDGKYSTSKVTKVWYDNYQKVQVYPNPASSTVTLHSMEQTTVELRDFYGRLLKRLPLTEGENLILLDDLSNGVYILKFGNGQVESFVKE